MSNNQLNSIGLDEEKSRKLGEQLNELLFDILPCLKSREFLSALNALSGQQNVFSWGSPAALT